LSWQESSAPLNVESRDLPGALPKRKPVGKRKTRGGLNTKPPRPRKNHWGETEYFILQPITMLQKNKKHHSGCIAQGSKNCPDLDLPWRPKREKSRGTVRTGVSERKLQRGRSIQERRG